MRRKDLYTWSAEEMPWVSGGVWYCSYRVVITSLDDTALSSRMARQIRDLRPLKTTLIRRRQVPVGEVRHLSPAELEILFEPPAARADDAKRFEEFVESLEEWFEEPPSPEELAN